MKKSFSLQCNSALAGLILASSSLSAAEPFKTADELGLMQGFPPASEKRVNRSNAILGVPYNRWAFQNMRMLFPTASIKHADVPVKLDRDIRGGDR